MVVHGGCSGVHFELELVVVAHRFVGFSSVGVGAFHGVGGPEPVLRVLFQFGFLVIRGFHEEAGVAVVADFAELCDELGVGHGGSVGESGPGGFVVFDFSELGFEAVRDLAQGVELSAGLRILDCGFRIVG